MTIKTIDYAENIGNTLKTLMQDNSVNLTRLCKDTGIPMPTLNRLISKKTPDPRASTLEAIASYFNRSVEQLIGTKSNIVKLASSPSLASKIIPVNKLDSILKNENVSYENILNVISDLFIEEQRFNLILDNDSMYPLFESGSTLVFDCQEDFKNRDFVIALINNNGLIFRQLLTEGQNRILKSFNPDFSAIHMTNNDLIIAKLIKSIRSF